MIKTFGDIRNEIIVRSGISTTTTFVTDTMIDDWVLGAYTWASAYHKWPFTEGRVSTTFSSVEEWSFEGYKADSFRLVQIGGKRLKKLDFSNYQIFREEQPDGDDRVFSDFGKLVFINPNVDLSGTLTAWGQYLPAETDTTDYTVKTVFSDNDEDGNEAIVNEALSYLKLRERKLNEADYHHNKAIEKLEGIWKRVLDEQYQYQTHPDSGGMFERVDVLKGAMEDDLFKRDQF